MRSFALITFLIVGLSSFARASDQIPATQQSTPILLTSADIYPVSGDVIHQGNLLFDKGKIVLLGMSIEAPPNAQRIDCTGKRIYPGLIDAMSDMGIVEIDAVRATIDTNETGATNPNARAEIAVNPDSELIPVARSNGVLLALVAPSGGTVSGSSALIQLDGWTWEDMTVKSPVAIHVNWPNMSVVTSWRIRETEKEQIKRRDDALKQIRQTFDDARAYMTSKSARDASAGAYVPSTQPDFDARWEAMIPLLEGKIPMIVRADDQQQIQAAIAFSAKEKVKLIIADGYDAPLCADLLKKYDVPVIITGVQRLPSRRGDDYDAAFTLPARLKAQGIRFCIAADRGAALARNLPYHAATAAAFGLSQDDALKSITLWPAQILGAADRIGSFDVGKDATLFIADGDILETPTHVERAFIQGRAIDLSNKQTRLWEKYKEKYKRLGLLP